MRRLLTLLLLLIPLQGFSQWVRFPVEYWTVEPKADTLTFYMVGDVLAHGRVVQSASEYGYTDFFKHVEENIRRADVAVCNMEFPLAGKPYTGYPVFSGPESFAEYLSDVGFDVFLTANNHVLDKGFEGLSRTIGQLEDRGILYTGVAASAKADTLLNPLILSVKGVRVALVNFTYGTNSGSATHWPKVHRMSREALAPVMARARAKADIILVFPHWGVEYEPLHSASQESMARWLISQGANVIIGSHPHVVQDMQWIDGVPVYYSLGNALSNQNDFIARLEAALTLRYVLRFGENPEMLPPRMDLLWCTKPGMIEDSYAAVPVDFPKSAWRDPHDHEIMTATLEEYNKKTAAE
ncbi:MAG: CapA family protein [Bacteroidales bacterium]|nr:CapA family protein [Bacteroidales bacterium]